MSAFKCGYVALLGRPNAGKSTLLNQILGSKLAITSAKPQTTRNRIVGIHSDAHMQAVLLDTPGVHAAWTELNRRMVSAAMGTLGEADVICWVADAAVMARRAEAGEPVLGEEDGTLLEPLERAGKPVVLALNKVDVVPAPLLLPVLDALGKRLDLAASVPLSALTGDGVAALLDEIRAALPEHPPFFPLDTWTQTPERFLVAEIVREKIFHLTEQEVPYSTAVEVVRFDEEAREQEGLVRIYADIIVERPSQKAIVIGRGGEMLKRIGTLARKEIQALLACRVYLELFVKVEKDWTRSAKGLRKVGYQD